MSCAVGRQGSGLYFHRQRGSGGQGMLSILLLAVHSGTPHASRYELLLESYLQNTAVIPTDEKVYDRIAINTLY